MLQQIRIQNFQSHSKLKIDFDPNITTIIGSSDKGKSAVIRALRWVCQNNPQGEEFIREGTKGTSVQLFLENRSIKRSRGKGSNSYHFDDAEYKAFGTNVPDPIKDFLRLDDINFQSQHDSPYWLSLPSGEVSRQLNAIVDLGIIDDSMAYVSKTVRKCQQDLRVGQERFEEITKKKEELKWVLEADAHLQEVEELEQAATDKREAVAKLTEQIRSITHQEELRKTTDSQREQLNSIGKLAHASRQISQKLARLLNLVQSINECEKQAQVKIPDISGVEQAVESYNEISKRKKDLLWLKNRIETVREALEQKKAFLKVAEEELEERTEGLCPICGSSINAKEKVPAV